MIQEWDIVISGFRQTLHGRTGSEDLWMKLRKLSSPTRSIQLLTWRADWKGLAAFIKRTSTPNPVIRVSAFSWGVGWGFIRLCNHLDRCGLRVHTGVWCDGIYRWPYTPDWFPVNPLSLTSWPSITVPHCVDELYWFYQTTSRPKGHKPKLPRGSVTQMHPGRYLSCSHVYADRQPAYHDLVLALAQQNRILHV